MSAPRRLVAAAALAGATLAGGGCEREPESPYFGTTERGSRDPATIYVNGFDEPESVDPGKGADTVSAQYVHAMFEGLTVYGPRDLRPVQGVATSWERSDDGRVLRFHLRPEARWSDGQPVTSHDFVYAWKRVLRPETGARAAPDLYPVKNAERYNQAVLKLARADLPIRRTPSGAPGGGVLEKGAAVVILSRAPPSADGKVEALVARHLDLPTYRPRGKAPPGDTPAAATPLGYVDEAELVADDSVLGVRAAGDLTLEIELERPTPYFLDLTCRPALAPVRRDVIEAFARRGEEDLWTRPENIVVNGPYTLDRWTFRYEITMKVNPHYWARDTLRTRKVVWLEVSNASTAMNLYRTAEVDLFGANVPIAPYHLPLLRSKRDLVRVPSLGTSWLELNTRARPLDDVRVRRALDLALDKRTLVDRILNGAAMPASHYVPDITGGGYAELAAAERKTTTDPFPDPVHDPERARALLREAGYEVVEEAGGLRAKGFPPLDLVYAGQEGKMVVAVQDMWRQHLGITLGLRSREWKLMLQDIRDGHFQIAESSWAADYNHPLTFLETFASGSLQNTPRWADPEFDALLARASDTLDPQESMRLYRQAEQRAVAGMSRLPLFFPAGSTLVKPWVKGYEGNGRVIDLVRWIWIDPSWRDHPGEAPGPVRGALDLPAPGKLR